MKPERRRRSWPEPHIHLLLRALLSPEAQAQRAWAAWQAIRNFDDVTWEEMRLLAPLALRLPALDPSSGLRPRVAGVARRMWTETQLRIAAAGPAFDTLSSAGIPFIVFKGASLYADGLGAATRRISGDVDILVRRRDFLPALSCLHTAGWGNAGQSLEYLARVAGIRAGCNLAQGERGDLDLHAYAFHFCRNDEAAEADLWETAPWRQLGGRQVRVPAPAHALLIATSHSYQSLAGDWAVELAARAGSQPVDWSRFAWLAGRRGLAAHAIHRFAYLEEGLGVTLPPEAMPALRIARPSAAERLKAWLSLKPKAQRGLLERAALLAIDQALRGADYSLERKAFVPNRYITPQTLSSLFASRSVKQAGPAEPTASSQVRIATMQRISKLLIEIQVGWPRRRRRMLFDVAIDGVTVAVLKVRPPRLASSRRSAVLSFRVPVPGEIAGPATVCLRALSARKLSAQPDPLEIEQVGPWPFALISLCAG
jgi:hypothetical protein